MKVPATGDLVISADTSFNQPPNLLVVWPEF